VIDVTRRSVEETAAALLQLLRARDDATHSSQSEHREAP
jgi:regulator of PEP synthase PpsR (kinase-PPPase family)